MDFEFFGEEGEVLTPEMYSKLAIMTMDFQTV
jgi:hypothetical protein